MRAGGLTVYIAADDSSVRQAVARLIRSAGMRAQVFEAVPDLVTRAGSDGPDCVIAGIRMPGTSGLELPGRLARRGHRPPVIFVTAYDTQEDRAAAKRARAVAFFQEKCMKATRLYGTVNFSGHRPGARLDFSPLEAVTHPGHSLLGQHDVRMRDREGLMRCLMNPAMQKIVDATVTHVHPMSRAGEAFDVQVSKKCGKIVIATFIPRQEVAKQTLIGGRQGPPTFDGSPIEIACIKRMLP